MATEKKLIDEVYIWLRLYDDGSVDRSWTGPPELKFMIDPVPSHPDQFINGVATRDVFTGPPFNLKMRIYLPEVKPENVEPKLPILLHFHGGGFCISRPDEYTYYQFYSPLSSTTRAICVSVFLPLAPEHRLPAACDHAYASLQWLRSVAQGESHDTWIEAHGDFSRVFVLGDSSGGNLVHQVAARAGNESIGPLKIAGAILIHPGICREERSRSESENPQSPFLTIDMVDKFLKLALPLGSNKDHPITCPMGTAAPPLESLNLPPIMMCVAEIDLLRDTNMEYYEAMKKANKDVELFTSPGMGHSFYFNKMAVDMDPEFSKQVDALIDAILEFIKKH